MLNSSASGLDVQYLRERYCFALLYEPEINAFSYMVTRRENLDSLSLCGRVPLNVIPDSAISGRGKNETNFPIAVFTNIYSKEFPDYLACRL